MLLQNDCAYKNTQLNYKTLHQILYSKKYIFDNLLSIFMLSLKRNMRQLCFYTGCLFEYFKGFFIRIVLFKKIGLRISMLLLYCLICGQRSCSCLYEQRFYLSCSFTIISIIQDGFILRRYRTWIKQQINFMDRIEMIFLNRLRLFKKAILKTIIARLEI